MKVTVCIGSSCHVKGSRQVVEQLQQLIAQNDLSDKVELGAIRWSWAAPSAWDSAKRVFALPLTTPSIRYLPKTSENFLKQT